MTISKQSNEGSFTRVNIGNHSNEGYYTITSCGGDKPPIDYFYSRSSDDASPVQDERGGDMSTDQMLQMYIEKMNQDQSDLRQDIRESERRIADTVERHQQILEQRIDQVKITVEKSNEATSQKLDQMQDKLDRMQDTVHSYKWQMWAMVITVILSMAGLVAAFIFGFPAWLDIVLSR